jgi:succinate dehydrogenase / fumarate reductase cytochrome b subunit
MLAWLFHRISGVIIALFLIFHILGFSGICPFLSKITGTKGIITAVGVIFAIHAVNGIRIILAEFFSSAEIKKFKVHIAAAAGVVLVVSALFVVKLLV